MPDLRTVLEPHLGGRTIIVGVGNRLRGDDAVGPALAVRLKAAGLQAWDVGTAPENYINLLQSSAPHTVLIVDSVDMGGPPGAVQILPAEGFTWPGFSTHRMPFQTLVAMAGWSPDRVCVVAIQPGCLDTGAEMSLPVKQALAELERLLTSLLSVSCT